LEDQVVTMLRGQLVEIISGTIFVFVGLAACAIAAIRRSGVRLFLWLGDRHGLTVSVCVESATPHEVTLATSTLLQMVVPDAPQNLIGDNAYDSDHLDAELKFYGIEVIAPHRRTRKNSTQDGRRLKRSRRR
jgi:hypothetical protein